MEIHRPTPGAFKKIGNREIVLEVGSRRRLVDSPGRKFEPLLSDY